MNIRSGVFFSALLMCTGVSYFAIAQDAADALRYSQTAVTGTARGMGIGGALGSIGGDFSTLSVNPAGIGVYRSSEFIFTPSIKLSNVNSTYSGTAASDNYSRFNFNNIGVVFTGTASGKRYERSKWKAVSFGLGVNRIADFNRNYTYNGFNNTSSMSELFLVDAQAYPDDIARDQYDQVVYPGGIGYQSFLIDLDTLTGQFFTNIPYQSGINQRRSVEERGGMQDIVISLGGNYMEKLMLGVTLGIPTISYNRETSYTETDATDNPNNDFKDFTYTESLNTQGVGVNLKLGFIYKPVEDFRFGLAVHTPTYYSMTDRQNRSITSNTEGYKARAGFNSGPVSTLQAGVDIPENVFEYSLLTPFRAVASAAGILSKFGFITADVEYVDYKSMRYDFDINNAESEKDINDVIKHSYKGAANVRLGAEARFDMLMVRLGFGYNGNPYATGGSERMDYSGGLGFRFDTWFVDLGYMHSQYEQQEAPYTLVYPSPIGVIDVPKATLKNSLNNVAITVGFKF